MRKIIIAILSLTFMAILAACAGNPSSDEQPRSDSQQTINYTYA